MSYRLDYEEPVPVVLERLEEEHREIDNKLSRIAEICESQEGKLSVALSLLNTIKTEILRHAVEEEARVARAILQSKETKQESYESISILQEHRRIKEFLEEKLPYLSYEASEKAAKREILEFIREIKIHHGDEERITFPLARKANLLS